MSSVLYAVSACKYGQLLVAASDKGVCDIALGDSVAELQWSLQQHHADSQLELQSHEAFDPWQHVVDHLELPDSRFNYPLDLIGTDFQRRVWQQLREIQCGTTITYKELAVSLHEAGAIRAVASACAANRLAVVVPCHRVVRTGGRLAGYRWGITRKKQLLEFECSGRPSEQLRLDK